MKMLKDIIGRIQQVDGSLKLETQRRLDNLTKPLGSLGRLEEFALQIVEISRQQNPHLKRKVVFTFAADHGVAAEGVSAYPSKVTAQMVLNFLRGGAGINVLARHAGAKVVIADLGVAAVLGPHPDLLIKKVGFGTKNMAHGPAMTTDEAIESITNGIAIFEQELKHGVDIAATGEMGIGNSTSASAITSVMTGHGVEQVTGKGTGVDHAAWQKKVETIKKAISLNKPDPQDGIDVLAKIGGYEIGGLTGVILAASAHRVPVVIDGFISSAAALIAFGLEPKTRDYMIASHCSVEPGHRIVWEHMGLKPILDLNLRLGEGTGAVLAMGLVEAGVKILNEMASFEAAGVSTKKSEIPGS